MNLPNYQELAVGDAIPSLKKAPLTRTTLALFAGASNDHNPVHIDIDFAQKAGFDDVFAHGMLVMAYLGQTLTQWVPQTNIREFSSRFITRTQVGDELTCQGTITEKFEQNGENCLRLALMVVDQNQETKIKGSAVIVLA